VCGFVGGRRLLFVLPAALNQSLVGLLVLRVPVPLGVPVDELLGGVGNLWATQPWR